MGPTVTEPEPEAAATQAATVTASESTRPKAPSLLERVTGREAAKKRPQAAKDGPKPKTVLHNAYLKTRSPPLGGKPEGKRKADAAAARSEEHSESERDGASSDSDKKVKRRNRT